MKDNVYDHIVLLQNYESEQDNQSQKNLEEAVATVSDHVDDPARGMETPQAPIPARKETTSQVPIPPRKETPSQAPIHSQKKRKLESMNDSSIEKSVAAVDHALNKLSTMTNQDMFDNFGNLVASQLRSIPLEHALQLQTEITSLLNDRLLMIHRGTSTSSSSLQYSRPSTSYSNYTDFSDHTPQYSQPVTTAYEDSNDPEPNSETTDIVSQALHGLLQ